MTIAVSAVLFDLDGTLVDPAGGITGGIAHALDAMGLPPLSSAELDSMIGPKLADALVTIAGVPLEQVPATVEVYRSWYRSTGMALSRVYPGIVETLGALKAAGVRIAVATQKPEPLAKILLAHHGLTDYFDVISGAHADESLMPGDPDYRGGKQEIIAAALTFLDVPHAVMVGDRYQDVRGAHANGLPCIGVAWGFAADGELAAAGAAAVVHTTDELLAVLAELPAPGTASLEAAHGAL